MALSTFYLSPGVYSQEYDLSQRIGGVQSSTGAIVGASLKGPIDKKFITSVSDFIKYYGEPDPSVSYMHDCAIDFLTQSNSLWVKRVHNGGLWAGAIVHTNAAAKADQTLDYNVDFPTGSPVNYEDGAGSRNVWLITIDAALVTADVIDIDLTWNGGGDTDNPSATFATNSNTTLAALATAIQSGGPSGTIAEVIDGGSSTDDDRIIRVLSPINSDLVLSGATVDSSGGSGTAVATLVEDCKLFDIFCENPGSWGNDVGYKINNIDKGTKARYKITFSKAFATAHTCTVTINGTAATLVTYATSNDATLVAIVAAIQTVLDANLDGATAGVISIAGAVDNDREIEIVAPDAETALTITVVTGGTSPPAATVSQTLLAIAPTYAFDLNIYTRDNVTTPIEIFRCSLSEQIDGYGNQLNIDQVVNEGTNFSSYVRIYQPEESKLLKVVTEMSSINWLTGGSNGSAVASSHIIAGWDDFADREEIEVRILINGGYTAINIQQYMVSLAEARKDCFAVLDMPSNLQDDTNALNYRESSLNINSSYGAIYTPDLKIVDRYTDIVRFIPPSGMVASTYAYTDRTRATWFSPAGLNRGLVRNIIDLRKTYSQGMRDLLSPAGVNCIIKKRGKGWVVWDDQTLQSKKSALSNINVRRLLILIEVGLTDALDYSVFEPNDEFTRFQIVQLINNFLKPIQQQRGLYQYLTVCDESNNKDYLIDEGQLTVDVYLKPTLPARFVKLSTIITRTGASFQELVAAGGSIAL